MPVYVTDTRPYNTIKPPSRLRVATDRVLLRLIAPVGWTWHALVQALQPHLWRLSRKTCSWDHCANRPVHCSSLWGRDGSGKEYRERIYFCQQHVEALTKGSTIPLKPRAEE